MRGMEDDSSLSHRERALLKSACVVIPLGIKDKLDTVLQLQDKIRLTSYHPLGMIYPHLA